MSDATKLSWHKVLDPPGLEEGRVMVVTAGTTTLALTRSNGQYGALENACPHQGGPLGEGSIEDGVEGKCWLRCPWHGWDFDPLTGESPGGHGDGLVTYAVEASVYRAGLPRDAGAVLIVELDGARVALAPQVERVRAIAEESGAARVEVARDDEERTRFWRARKGAFGAMGRLAPDLYVHDAVVPRRALPEVLEKVCAIGDRHGARRVIAAERAAGGTGFPWEDGLRFATLAYWMSVGDHATADENPTFFDRSALDQAAWFHREGHAVPGEVPAYAEDVFVAPPWPDIYREDEDRQHAFGDAVAEYDDLMQRLPEWGYLCHVLPKTGVEERAYWVLSKLGLDEAVA